MRYEVPDGGGLTAEERARRVPLDVDTVLEEA